MTLTHPKSSEGKVVEMKDPPSLTLSKDCHDSIS